MRYVLAFNKRLRPFSIFLAAFLLLTVSSCSLQRAARPGRISVPAENPLPVNPEENTALASKEHGHADKAISDEKIGELSPETVWRRRESFLLGLDSIEKGEPGDAYFKDAESLPHLDDYLLFYRARALQKKNRPADAASILDSLISRHPDSALRAESIYFKATALSAAGDSNGAEKEFSRFISEYPENPLVPQGLLGFARASFMLKKQDYAAQAARSILVGYPARSESKEAAALLEEIKAEGGVVPEMTDEERFARGKRLLSASRYRDAIVDFSALSKKIGSPYRDSSVIKLAAASMRLKQYEKAEKTLRDYLDEKEKTKELDALYLLANIALRRGSEETLLDAGKSIALKYPKSPEYGRVLLMTGKFYEPKDPDRALSIYIKVLDEFKDGPFSSIALDALWDMGWVYYMAGKYENALARFSSWDRYECRDASKFLYWSGRSAEKLGKAQEASDFFGRLCEGFKDTYYCWMAGARHGVRAEPVAVDSTVDTLFSTDAEFYQAGPYGQEPQGTFLKVYGDGHYLAAKELLAMGLGSMASKEIDFIAKKYSAEPDEMFELAQMFLMAGDYHDALKVYNLYLSVVPGRRCGKGPSDVLAIGFPSQVVGLVRDAAPEATDPYLAAAVMREESGFDPRVVSVSGALGLMQIMPSTGRTLAKELGEEDFDPSKLFNPRINIRYGATYLDELSKLFDDNAILAIAGYNAGPNAAEAWKDAFHLAPDEFIESIPYPETRMYTKRVLRSYMEFLRLSGVSNPLERIIKSNANGNFDGAID